MSAPVNILTVDLEEWFVVEALAGHIAPDDWSELPSTLERNTDRLLWLFHKYEVRATFYVVGWCAERNPGLIRRIAEAGHEIGCHSYGHRRVDTLGRDDFRGDVERANRAIFEACGVRPRGFRAPTWSLNDTVPWAFETLADLGFEYDSSVFPIKHDLYGMPDAPRQMFRMSFGGGRFIYEVPASTYRFLGRNFPIGGGGYLRHSPYWFTRWITRRLNGAGQPVVVYMHPWEIDARPPAVKGLSKLQRFRTYGSTDLFEAKLVRLLQEFRFTTMIDYIRQNTRHKIGFER